MKLKPVKDYKLPVYPRENDFQPETPKTMPFISKKALIMAITALTMNLNMKADNRVDTKQTTLLAEVGNKTKTSKKILKKIYECAPVFEHGDGRGYVGCEVIVQPVFISEDDAHKIISEMLAKWGIVFDEKNKSIDNLYIKKYFQKVSRDDITDSVTVLEETLQKSIPLVVDLFSTNLNLGLIYVSKDDYYKYGIGRKFPYNSDCLVKDTAQRIVSQVSKENKFYCAVIYDPVGYMDIIKNDKEIIDLLNEIETLRKTNSAYYDSLRGPLQDFNKKYVSMKNDKKLTEEKKEEFKKEYKLLMGDYGARNKKLRELEELEKTMLIEKAKQLSLSNLQAQVNDFITWLKEKKIIEEVKK